MYFDVVKRPFANHRVRGFKCLVHNNNGKVVYKKNFAEYRDAWDWGYEKVRLVRR